MRVTKKVVLQISGDSLDDVITALQKIQTEVGPEPTTLEMDSYELVVEWSEEL